MGAGQQKAIWTISGPATTPAVNTELHANRANEVNEKAQFLAAA
jgi:hypothetical protein